MTQIECIIQGLMIIQSADPDVKIEASTRWIIAYVKGMNAEAIERMQHIGWKHIKGTADDIFGFRAEG